MAHEILQALVTYIVLPIGVIVMAWAILKYVFGKTL